MSDVPARPRPGWATVVAAVVVYVAGLIGFVLVGHPSLGADLFFDEMWRAVLIRSGDVLGRYELQGAPIPLAWLYVLQVTSAVLPDGFRSLRVQSLALSAPLVVACWAIGRGLLADRLGPRSASIVAAAASLLVVALPATGVARYLNDYLFQAACTAVVVWLWWRHEQVATVRSGRALLVGVVLLPLATMAGLFVLPVIAVDLLRPRRVPADRSPLPHREVVGAFVLAGLVSVVLALLLYAPQSNDGLSSFWADGSLRSSGWDALPYALDRLWDNFLPMRSPLVDGGLRHAVWAQVLVAVCAVVGLVVLGRRWPPYPITLGVAVVLTAAASLVADWPFAPERVNEPYLWMLHLAVAVGALQLLLWAVRSSLVVAALAVPLALAVAPSWPPDGGPEPFARGLTDDLEVVAASPVADNVVLSYHFMSHYYAHDRLVTRATPDRTFTVVRDVQSDDRLTADPDAAAIEAGWAPGTAVWCVLPFELGPEGTTQACQLTLPGLVRQPDVRLSRAVIVAWLPEGVALPAPPTQP